VAPLSAIFPLSGAKKTIGIFEAETLYYCTFAPDYSKNDKR
jgi:hypothetical protein